MDRAMRYRLSFAAPFSLEFSRLDDAERFSLLCGNAKVCVKRDENPRGLARGGLPHLSGILILLYHRPGTRFHASWPERSSHVQSMKTIKISQLLSAKDKLEKT